MIYDAVVWADILYGTGIYICLILLLGWFLYR